MSDTCWTEEPDLIEQLRAEIERLRGLIIEVQKSEVRHVDETRRLRSIAFGAEEYAQMAEAEIKRLRAEMAQAEQNWAADWKREFEQQRRGPMTDQDWVTVDGVRYEPRAKVIEECARVAETYAKNLWPTAIPRSEFVAAIRALKDKP